MTTTDIDRGAQVATAPRRGTLARIWNVARLHFANPFPTLVLPWLITAAIFGLNAGIWGIILTAAGAENLDDNAFTNNGGAVWILFFFTVVAVQAMNLTFHFALGFTVTRRDFYLGSVVYFLLLALIYATGFTAFAALERATGGWGLDGAFFAPAFLLGIPLAHIWYFYFTLMTLFLFLGSAVATIWVRWKSYGLYAFFVSLAVILLAAVWGITQSGSWGAVGRFFVDNSLPALVTWTLPVTVVCGVLGLFILRRATARS